MPNKIILSIISLATSCFFLGCGEKPISTIIQMTKEEVKNIFPKSFEVNHDGERMKGFVYINDTLKLFYRLGIMSTKSQLDQDIYSNNNRIDTIQERVLRLFKIRKIAVDKYDLSFKMMDLRAKDIPTIFGNPRNNRLQYAILDMYTSEKYPLSKNEKDALIKSIFNDPLPLVCD